MNRNFTSEELGVAQSAYQQFWAKLESIMGPNRQDFLGVLARNKVVSQPQTWPNMNLTYEAEFLGRFAHDYK